MPKLALLVQPAGRPDEAVRAAARSDWSGSRLGDRYARAAFCSLLDPDADPIAEDLE